AVVEWTTDWREDAARRDFTINAMSMSAAGEVWDYFHGRDDLTAGRVRFVGDPATRLAEDYLRALRFFRFQARYGRGAPDPAAVAAIRDAVPHLGRLSAERVWMELKRLLAAPDPTGAVALMAETGVLGAVLPEGFDLRRLETLIAAGAPADPLLRFAALLARGARDRQVATRLRLSRDEAGRIGRARQTHGAPDCGASEARLRAWASEAGPDALAQCWIAQIEVGGDCWDARRQYIRTHEGDLKFPLQGRDVLELGVTPGEAVGSLLSDTVTWWRGGGCIADRATCLSYLRELAVQNGLL
ncbi:MAG: CCA tRNA nucleotidyltransferase, partial [Acetobacteraceae bacterium]|nr:CCA tRNA nucleotidyltransferase [Acetobacteraceae bacterium]